MSDPTRTGPDAPPRWGGDHPLWALALLALLSWQGWLTLSLFGGTRPWESLLDDRPVLSGRHPLHLYHGFLGARTLRERGTLSCFDPSFHAGYPKTPVFDSGSRPAELALLLAGSTLSPAAYKLFLAFLAGLVPLWVYVAARGAGLQRGTCCLSCLLAVLVWWGRPCRESLEAGDADLLLASVLALAQAGLLVGYHRQPSVRGLAGLVLAALAGWFAHPPLMALLLPLFLIYYLSVGCRHGLAWHIPLLAGLSVAVAVNAFWLLDWMYYWWIRVPLSGEAPMLAHRTLRALWEAQLWGGSADRGLACVLLGVGAAGVVLLNQGGQRGTARLFGTGAVGFVILAVAGTAWEPFGRLGASQLLFPGLLFAAVPAGFALGTGAVALARRTGAVLAPVALAAAVLGGAWMAFPAGVQGWLRGLQHPGPLELGLGEERADLIEKVREQTTNAARILWEDRRTGRLGSRWTALLPLLTEEGKTGGRSFVGGLDPEAGIEHAAGGLVDQVLAGKPVKEWSDQDLELYCKRYNIGWVVCWAAGTQQRFRAWAGAEEVCALHDPAEPEGPGRLFRLKRKPSFALVGSAQLRAADTRHILLAEVVPEAVVAGEREGEVVLSLHYQAGMRVTPARVRLEPARDRDDSISFVRLRLSEPVGRVMITWEGR